MYRNDAVVPFFAVLFAVALFLMAYLNTQMRVEEKVVIAGAPAALSVGSVGLMTYAMVLFVYGFIGLLGNWLEGPELRPGKHQPEPSSLPVVAGVVLSILLVVLSGFFVRTLVFASAEGYNPTALQGGVFAAMMLLIALLIAIYKKFFIPEEVLAEDEKSDFPW